MARTKSYPTKGQDSIDGQSPDAGDEPDVEAWLSELIDLHERVDWSTVPEVSTLEAATWTQRLDEARETARERGSL